MALIDQYLMLLRDRQGSDLHLTANEPPHVRIDGSMAILRDETLKAEMTQRIFFEFMPQLNRKEFEDTSDTDFGYDLPEVARFRVNVFRDLHGVGGVLRLIPNQIRSLSDLGVPDVVTKFCELPNGLILITGPTGSGKSTTLAALIDHINTIRRDHIITIEDPIEFVHRSKGCLINQREVRSHTGSFSRALRAALREDPDIVLVGEMRDLETMRIAIETAETGHLVFATLHTRTAASTVDRLIGQFSAEEQEQIRVMAANSLKGVVAQTLLKKRNGGRVGVFEVMVVTPAVQNTIRENKLHQIMSIMQVSGKHGMICLNDALLRLVLNHVVDAEEALARAEDKDDFQRKLQVAGVGPRPTAELTTLSAKPLGSSHRIGGAR